MKAHQAFCLGLGISLFLTGCATTLRNPQTGHEATCKSGGAVAVGWGPIGWALMGLAAITDVVLASEYKECQRKLREQGYTEEVTQIPRSE